MTARIAEAVPSGRACCCLCPSCRFPLQQHQRMRGWTPKQCTYLEIQTAATSSNGDNVAMPGFISGSKSNCPDRPKNLISSLSIITPAAVQLPPVLAYFQLISEPAHLQHVPTDQQHDQQSLSMMSKTRDIYLMTLAASQSNICFTGFPRPLTTQPIITVRGVLLRQFLTPYCLITSNCQEGQ